jgi:hypothetical protein
LSYDNLMSINGGIKSEIIKVNLKEERKIIWKFQKSDYDKLF